MMKKGPTRVRNWMVYPVFDGQAHVVTVVHVIWAGASRWGLLTEMHQQNKGLNGVDTYVV